MPRGIITLGPTWIASLVFIFYQCVITESSKIYSGRACESKSHGRNDKTLYCGQRKSIILLEGSQASPDRPSDKGAAICKRNTAELIMNARTARKTTIVTKYLNADDRKQLQVSLNKTNVLCLTSYIMDQTLRLSCLCMSMYAADLSEQRKQQTYNFPHHANATSGNVL
jgi:hypothetical protein